MPTELRKIRDNERKERTRTSLIAAATSTFARQGYHKTLISDIVKEAGVGQGTFYRNFENKQEVFEVIFDDFVNQAISQFADMSANLPSNLQEYKSASLNGVLKLVRLVEENAQVSQLFLREGNAIDPEFEAKVSGFLNRFAQLAQFYLDHAISAGFARPCRSDLVAQSLIGIGLRLADMWWQGEFADLNSEQIAEEIVEFAFRGFGLYDHQINP